MSSGALGATRLEKAFSVVVLVAAATGVCTFVAAHAGVVPYLGVLLAVAGWVMAFVYGWPGLLMVMAAPVVTAAGGWYPVLAWSLVVFAAFVWALRGLPPVWLGLATGAASYGAFAIYAWKPVDSLTLLAFVMCVAAAATGAAVRARSETRVESARRAEETEKARNAEIDRRVVEERLRIARDLHDSVGHQAAVVNMHLGTAEVHLPHGAERSRADVHAARGAVQAVLVELERILEILRLSPEEGLAPTAEYEHIEALVDSYRAAGLDVVTDIAPRPAEMPGEVAAATYRIVQEALTNAQKHGTGQVALAVSEREGVVVVEVSNAVAAARTHSPGGHGLLGMSERAAAVGGTLGTEVSGGTYRLRAALPLPAGGLR